MKAFQKYVLLGKALKTFELVVIAKGVQNDFGYIGEFPTHVLVTREGGLDTKIPYTKLLTVIEVYQANPELYDIGPAALRDFGITHITSPIWAILHLLKKTDYLD